MGKHMKINTTQLDYARERFKQWRTQKSYKSEPIPDELWSIALNLITMYPLPRIAVTLKISIANLKNKAKELNFNITPALSGQQNVMNKKPVDKEQAQNIPTEPVSHKNGSFTQSINVTRIDLPKDWKEESKANGEVVIKNPDGSVLSIPYDCPPVFAVTLLSTFMKGGQNAITRPTDTSIHF